jgi:hypothetical protein
MQWILHNPNRTGRWFRALAAHALNQRLAPKGAAQVTHFTSDLGECHAQSVDGDVE